MNARKVILLGRELKNLERGLKLITVTGIEFTICNSLESLSEALKDEDVDTVITGAGLPIETRLDAIRMIYEASDKISVHMKDYASGPVGFGPFADRVLKQNQ